MICRMDSGTSFHVKKLLGFQADVMQTMAQNKQADAIIVDFSYAFDKVSHKRLATKMEQCSVRGQTNAGIRGFLADTSQTGITCLMVI